MKKLTVSNIMSLDGYYAGPDNNFMLLPMDRAFDSYNLERMRAADIVLLGHDSCRMFSGFWPGKANQPNASPTHREFSRFYNKLEKVVVSHKITLKNLTGPWKDTTRIKGTPMFPEPIAYNDPKRSLQLIDSRKFKGSENLLVQYQVKY